MAEAVEYDPRYLAGVELFNRQEFFDAHEVWEELWHDTVGGDRRFYQALIQAAVAAYHALNGNHPGTQRLFASAERYMRVYPPLHLGLRIDEFWHSMQASLGEFLNDPTAAVTRFPTIHLHAP